MLEELLGKRIPDIPVFIDGMISEATAHISGALNIENILHATAEELERVLGGSEVLIRFKREQKA